MDRLICLHSTTALELYRKWDLRVPTLPDLPRTSSLAGCLIPGYREAEDTLSCLGLTDGPFHLLVGSDSHASSNEHVVRHVWSAGLPRRSLIRLGSDVLLPCPELCFVQIAAEMARPGTECSGQRWSGAHCRFPWIDEVTLALIGFELCGTYFLDPESSKGFRNTSEPLTSAAQIERYLAKLGRQKGTGLARRAIRLVQDGSHSPMETAMALQLTGPRRVGGMGLPVGRLNCHIATRPGDRWVDLGWKDRGVGIEYQGKDWHTDAELDDRRRNGVVGAGMNLFIARFRDLSSIDLFERLATGLARALGVRLRVRDREFIARRSALWREVLPPLDRG